MLIVGCVIPPRSQAEKPPGRENSRIRRNDEGFLKVLSEKLTAERTKNEKLKQKADYAAMWFRYDIQAFYNIEKSGYSPFDILSQSTDPKAVRCFLRNGLADWYSDLEDDHNDLDSYVNGLMSAEGFQTELIALMQAAIMLALPRASVGNKKKSDGGAPNILGLMSMFVDVMGAPKAEFMSSTIREATERWNRYAVAMGYQKPAEKFSRFDDDDDDE